LLLGPWARVRAPKKSASIIALPNRNWVVPIRHQTILIIGERSRALREEKKLSPGDIEKLTGLLRCYVSRAENGHTLPAVEMLEKFAHALEVPRYQLFYEGEEPPKLPNLPKRKAADDLVWGSKGKDARLVAKFCRLFGRMEAGDLGLVLFMAQKMAEQKAV
jgi:transcriptional regulator with XRE-family HTH domain